MRILYGVQTTGHGHLVRSTPIIRALRARGHEVHALLSGPLPGAAWLQRIGPPLSSHPGLSFTADGGRIRYLRTALAARPLRFLGDVLAKPAVAFDLVITDYEPVSAWLARLRGIRSVGIGHLYSFVWPTVPRAPGNLITRTVLEHFAPADIVAGTHWDDYGGPILPPTIDPDVLTLVRRPAESGPRRRLTIAMCMSGPYRARRFSMIWPAAAGSSPMPASRSPANVCTTASACW
jgi:uncharacterized protein (TIGR00661 family)